MSNYAPLALKKIGRNWSFYDITNEAHPQRIGPTYETSAEALADLERWTKTIKPRNPRPRTIAISKGRGLRRLLWFIWKYR